MKNIFYMAFVAIISLVLSVSTSAQVLPAGCTSTKGFSPTTGEKCAVLLTSTQATQANSSEMFFATPEECNTACVDGSAPVYQSKPPFTKNRPNEESRERHSPKANMCVLMLTYGGGWSWVVQDPSVELAWKVSADGSEKPTNRWDCWNGIRSSFYCTAPTAPTTPAITTPPSAAQPLVIKITNININDNTNDIVGGQPSQIDYVGGYQGAPVFGLSFGLGIGFDGGYGGNIDNSYCNYNSCNEYVGENRTYHGGRRPQPRPRPRPRGGRTGETDGGPRGGDTGGVNYVSHQ